MKPDGMCGVLTSLARTGQEYGLEPSRKVVHHGEVACGDKEVADSDQNRDLLLQEERRKNRFWCDLELDPDEENKEDAGESQRQIHRRRRPLYRITSIDRGRVRNGEHTGYSSLKRILKNTRNDRTAAMRVKLPP